MPLVRCTPHLQRFFPGLGEERVPGTTAAAAIAALDARYPGLARYVLDDQGALRPHVNVFIGKEPVRDRKGLSDPVAENAELTIMQALSGG